MERRNAELEQRSRELAEELRRLERDSAPEKQRAETAEKLKQTLAEQFEVRTALRRRQRQHLESELAAMREAVRRVSALEEELRRVSESLSKREEEREALVRQRMEELLGRTSPK